MIRGHHSESKEETMSSTLQCILSSSSMSELSVPSDPLPKSSTLTLTLTQRSSSAKHFGRGDARHHRKQQQNKAELSKRQSVATPRQFLPSEAGLLSQSLEEFHEELVRIDHVDRDIALVNTERLLNTISAGLTKHLVKSSGLKVLGFVKTGSLFDDTCVVSPNDVDVLVLFRCVDVTSVAPGPGYAVVPLDCLPEEDERGNRKRDRWKFGRSADGRHLSSQTVAWSLFDLLKRILLPGKSPSVQLKPFNVETSVEPQLTIVSGNLSVHLSPSCSLTADRDEPLLVSRPYPFDVDPASDILWRLHFPTRESKILDLIRKSDRGVRMKAFKILKVIVKQDDELRGLASYHIKTVLLRTFDLEVDKAERWQRATTESVFVALLTDLRDCLDAQRLPHFYDPRFNLFGNVPSKLLTRWKRRIDRLVEDHGCIVRTLRRILAEHSRKQTNPSLPL